MVVWYSKAFSVDILAYRKFLFFTNFKLDFWNVAIIIYFLNTLYIQKYNTNLHHQKPFSVFCVKNGERISPSSNWRSQLTRRESHSIIFSFIKNRITWVLYSWMVKDGNPQWKEIRDVLLLQLPQKILRITKYTNVGRVFRETWLLPEWTLGEMDSWETRPEDRRPIWAPIKEVLGHSIPKKKS